MNFPSARFLGPSVPIRSIVSWGILALVLWPLSGCRSSAEPEAMQAVKAAEHIAQELEAGNMHVIWECWSDAQRADINQVVHRFAEKAPPELWSRGFEVAGLWGKVLKEKREFALNCPALERGHAGLKEHGEILSAFLTRLAESDLGELDKLKTADVGDLAKQVDPLFLQGMPAIFALFPNSAETKVALEAFEKGTELLSTAAFALGEHGDDWAMVHVATDDGVSKLRFIKTDNRWIPELPAKDWKSGMDAANQWVDEFDLKSFPQLALVNAMLDAVVKARLQQALDAKTQAEFDALFAEGSDPVLPFFFFAGEKKFVTF